MMTYFQCSVASARLFTQLWGQIWKLDIGTERGARDLFTDSWNNITPSTALFFNIYMFSRALTLTGIN